MSGLLFQRSVVVSNPGEFRDLLKSSDKFNKIAGSDTLSEGQKRWIKLVTEKENIFDEKNKPLKEEARDKWNQLGEENLKEMQRSVVIMLDYFAKEDLFVPRC